MSFLRHKPAAVVYGILCLLLAAAWVLSVAVGSTSAPWDVRSMPIFHLRAVRALMASVAGAGLSVAGVIFQSLLRNALAEPYVLGVTAGAGVGAALAIIRGMTIAGAWTVPGMAFAGALGTIVLVQTLARTRAGAMPVETMLLAGVTVSAILNSLLMFLVSVAPSDKLHGVVWWLLGNLFAAEWRQAAPMAVVVVPGLAVSILLARDLNLMALGDAPASHLGLNVERSRLLFFVIASLVTGATVAACGIIGFVGLIVPHAMRLVVGPDHRRLVPATAIAGATFLVLADCLARTLLATEIPIGVVTALAGGPLFLMLLRRHKTAKG